MQLLINIPDGYKDKYKNTQNGSVIAKVILNAVAEGTEVENGQWIIYDVHCHNACKCSKCNSDIGYDKRHYMFCPYCGSKNG